MSDDDGIRLDCLTCATTVVLGSGMPTAAARAFFTDHPSCVTVIDTTDQLVGWTHAGRRSVA